MEVCSIDNMEKIIYDFSFEEAIDGRRREVVSINNVSIVKVVGTTNYNLITIPNVRMIKEVTVSHDTRNGIV